MSKRHKWYREICAWADGAEIEYRCCLINGWTIWESTNEPMWGLADEYRIKAQPIQTFKAPTEPTHVKKPQYLYVYLDDNYELSTIPLDNDRWKYIGKIKLEVEE